MGKRVGAALFVVAALTLLASVTVLAASGYSVGVSVPSPVISGQSFSVNTRGTAVQKALLYVYLDHRRCRSVQIREAARVNTRTFKAGQSYFPPSHQAGAQPKPEAFDYAWVSGSFQKSFKAVAGNTAEHEYVCAYLMTPNRYGGYRVSATHGSTRYAVTR